MLRDIILDVCAKTREPFMSPSFPILYSFRRCPYAMRARLALYSAEIAHEHREVNLKDKPQEMLTISPKGTVPILQLEGGIVLEQSLDIINWALKNPPLPLEDSQAITENDTTFKQSLDRYKYPRRYLEEIGVNYREHCEVFLRKLEAHLDPFLRGNTLALTDMAIFPFIRQFAMVDPEWFKSQPYPRLKVWLNFFISSPLFCRVMQEHSPWSPGDAPNLVVF